MQCWMIMERRQGTTAATVAPAAAAMTVTAAEAAITEKDSEETMGRGEMTTMPR
jgi:hypothetical protein